MACHDVADRILEGMDGGVGSRRVTYDLVRQMGIATEIYSSGFADTILALM